MDFNKEKFETLVHKSLNIIENWYESTLRNNKIYHNNKVKDIKRLFNIAKDNKSIDPEKILDHIDQHLLHNSNFNPSPNYYGYITGGGNQIGIIAEFLKSALNQNNLKWHSAPANTEIEKLEEQSNLLQTESAIMMG